MPKISAELSVESSDGKCVQYDAALMVAQLDLTLAIEILDTVQKNGGYGAEREEEDDVE